MATVGKMESLPFSERMLEKRARQKRWARMRPVEEHEANLIMTDSNHQRQQDNSHQQQRLPQLSDITEEDESIMSHINTSGRPIQIKRRQQPQMKPEWSAKSRTSKRWPRWASVAPMALAAAVALLLMLGGLLQLGEASSSPTKITTSRKLERRQRDLQMAPMTGGGGSGDMQLTLASSQQQPTCGYPGSPAHASVTFNTSQVVAGTAASYTCDNGYELLGPPRRLCQANGTWSPVGIPFCVLNVGLGKAAMQSSTAGQGSAQKAVDGSTSPYFQASTCTMTDVESSPWWYVNLLEPYLVQIVRIDFGTACCANRQKATIAVRVGNNRPDLGNNPLCNRYQGYIEEGKPLFLPCTRPAPGAFVSIHLEAPTGSALSICETFIYTDHALSIEQCPSFRDQPLGSTATYNGKCYLFHNNQALSFESAHKYCESRGGTLVDETSPALQGFLSWELYRRHRNDGLLGQYWLGAVKDARQPANWKWTSGKDVQISFWSEQGPKVNNCSRFDGSKGWLWTDTDCQAQLNFICQHRPLSCGKPEKPTNSTLVTRNVDNGTVIEYQCAPGNLLMGPKSRACLPTGFFSEFAPKCKYLDCQFPAMIANGDYKLLNGTTSYQSLVSYFCQEGHQLYGKATLTCDLDERWNGPPPRCEPLLCPAPVPPSNGYVTVSSNITVPGTQATYDCRPGYELVGERLLTCSQAGAWDQSFPYCRERRSPPLAATPPRQRQPAVGQRLAPIAPQQQSGGSVQFPGAARQTPASSTPSSTTSTTTTTTTTTAASTTSGSAATPPPPPSTSTTTTTAASATASLNGLAGQFVVPPQQQPPSPPQSPTPFNPFMATSQAPPQAQPQPPAQQVPPEAAPPAVAASSEQRPRLPQQLQQPTNLVVGPQDSQPALMAAANTQQPPRYGQRPSSPSPPAASSTQPQGNSRVNRPPVAATGQPQFQPFGEGPAQATQSFNVHQPAGSSHSVSSVLAASSPSSPASSPSPSSSSPMPTTASVGPTSTGGLLANNNQLAGGGTPSVLASLGASGGRQGHPGHLASAKYSLDGIIAVAIFGGFIFLGAIITIIVIIIRRKSSHSSSIDAQTISTYDSQHGEPNGLYRNYQQAWENLRFAAPNSQPKSSGGGGGASSLAPVVGLKNFGSPVHHAHAHHLHHAHLLHTPGGGHQNLGLVASGSSSGSSGSSQSSSLGGTTSHAGAVGGDPLLRPAHSHSHAHHAHPHPHHHHSHHNHSHDHHLDDNDDEEEEQGVLSSDESHHHARHAHAHHHHPHHHHHHAHHQHHYNEQQQQHLNSGSQLAAAAASEQASLAGEGFRDSNELTINADTCPAPSNLAGASATTAVGQMVRATGGGHRRGPSGASSSQRLVGSSTPSASTRSSRASPPSGDDDHSLDRLAYGSGWNQSGQVQHQQPPNPPNPGGSSHHSHDSASQSGSGASMLGVRASLRYT